jgi:hypothetical protein
VTEVKYIRVDTPSTTNSVPIEYVDEIHVLKVFRVGTEYLVGDSEVAYADDPSWVEPRRTAQEKLFAAGWRMTPETGGHWPGDYVTVMTGPYEHYAVFRD